MSEDERYSYEARIKGLRKRLLDNHIIEHKDKFCDVEILAIGFMSGLLSEYTTASDLSALDKLTEADKKYLNLLFNNLYRRVTERKAGRI